MEPRPEDRKDAEIADGAGELGFFPPYSWWPLWCALCCRRSCSAWSSAGGWSSSAPALGFVALAGWVFEYYRGEHAH